MQRLILLVICSFLIQVSGCTQNGKGDMRCEDCEMMLEGMPGSLSWKTNLSPPDEPGEPVIISGTIYKQDGKTPAPDVILYVYHTDKTGHYSPAPGQKHARRHGHLRGWMKTDAEGRYQFTSIRPAAYPNRKDPQHIHPIVKEPNRDFYWIDEYLFEDDPLVTADVRAKQQKRGGSGIIQLKKNNEGVWIGKRDIILGQNIPIY